MNNRYYSLPVEFKDIMSMKDSSKSDLHTSIAQNLHLMATTHFGESKFNSSFGCTIWDMDFDNRITDIEMKGRLKSSLAESIEKNEKRIIKVKLTVKIILDEVDSARSSKSIKKRIDISINANLRSTNEAFTYFEYFFIGPLSYY